MCYVRSLGKYLPTANGGYRWPKTDLLFNTLSRQMYPKFIKVNRTTIKPVRSDDIIIVKKENVGNCKCAKMI